MDANKLTTIPKTSDYVVALAGNPNTGKSTVFNSLTGLKQHTGNWPGKTVLQAYGYYHYKNHEYLLIDLPGTYSLLSHSPEEQVARDFICFAQPDATVVVVDATSLERNLNLVLQVLEITSQVIVCLNLVDEAKRKKLKINSVELGKELGVPVVETIARGGHGLQELQRQLQLLVLGETKTHPRQIQYPPEIETAINRIVKDLSGTPPSLNKRWLALRLLEGDLSMVKSLETYLLEFETSEVNVYGSRLSQAIISRGR